MAEPEDDRIHLAQLRDDSKQRQLTFENNWPSDKSFIPVEELIREGFYYMGRGDDSVQCTYCRGIIRNWVQGDDVYLEHCRLFPHCPFVKSVFKYPQYCDVEARLASFKDWPSQLKQQPRQMSKAGFYYIGVGDKVQCFWCGTVLKDWEPSDDPVLEHVRWSSSCSWMLIIKGENFIQGVLTSQSAETQTVIRQPEEDDPLERAQQMGYSPEKIQKAVERLGSGFDLQSLLETIMDLESVPVIIPQEPSGPDLSPPERVEISPPSISGAQAVIPNHPSMDELQLHSLTRENFSLKLRTQCKICMEEDVCVVFLPCGHLVCCFSCASLLQECPICRGRIEDKVRIFW
ncbi:baculoviral IAP repeat-containing protein 3-like [Mizuhopecten yessoensis]|uniref:Apoptosis 2 inhibitor n=1 Tax=Mizuhopecten yessoensis TaxID=6573 RepID=A0A210Q1Z7_MIZYE|nr:baculoviral IAP repeat-containing protein 3-like [Mizuhopecten yessoensis]OWF42752.1 Apoptosis 2 inhibitor [Mizuhopecten yessoensis]